MIRAARATASKTTYLHEVGNIIDSTPLSSFDWKLIFLPLEKKQRQFGDEIEKRFRCLVNKQKQEEAMLLSPVLIGGRWGIRTPDPLLVRQTLWTNWAKRPFYLILLSFSLEDGAKIRAFSKPPKNAMKKVDLFWVVMDHWILLLRAYALCPKLLDRISMAY